MTAQHARWSGDEEPLWGADDATTAQQTTTNPLRPEAVPGLVPLSEAVAEYVMRALDAREAQGLPRYVSDPAVVEEIDRILQPKRP